MPTSRNFSDAVKLGFDGGALAVTTLFEGAGGRAAVSRRSVGAVAVIAGGAKEADIVEGAGFSAESAGEGIGFAVMGAVEEAKFAVRGAAFSETVFAEIVFTGVFSVTDELGFQDGVGGATAGFCKRKLGAAVAAPGPEAAVDFVGVGA